MERNSYRGIILSAQGHSFDDSIDPTQEASIVIGLGLGDECKGMAVAHEAARAVSQGCSVLDVRFNGGPQAAHNVTVRKTDGTLIHHTHSQFGSGTLLGASTMLTSGMLVSPVSLIREADALAEVTGDGAIEERLMIDASAPVLLPMHSKANCILETRRGKGRHGSTGLGIGVARTCEAATKDGDADPSMLVTVGDLIGGSMSSLQRKIAFWSGWIGDRFGIDLGMGRQEAESEADWVSSVMSQIVGRGATIMGGGETAGMLASRLGDGYTAVVFEGSQGIMLDERYGWFPHVTYGDMTAAGALGLVGDGKRRIIGVTRCYQTRHGAGPFPSEGLFVAPEKYNGDGQWTGAFRTGLLDMPMLRAAAEAVSPDCVAVSCLDRWPGRYVAAWESEEAVEGIRRPIPIGAVIAETDEAGVIGEISKACGDRPVTVTGRGEVIDEWDDTFAS